MGKTALLYSNQFSRILPPVNFSLQRTIPEEQETLKMFLFLAIYVPPGGDPPDRLILCKPELARYYQNWGKPDDYALFAVQERQVLGACWSRCFPEDLPGYGTIGPGIPELSIAVLPEARGLGVGTHLLGHFLQLLAPVYHGISLSVHPNNPALRLYERFGFLVHQADQHAVTMVKWFE